jgi:hypothetical protein
LACEEQANHLRWLISLFGILTRGKGGMGVQKKKAKLTSPPPRISTP